MASGMRAAQLPPNLALCRGSCRHWIVAAGANSESYQCFCRAQGQASGRHGSTASTPPPSHAAARFRPDHLLPGDWSALLRHCRRLTSPHGSFSYSSPGDAAAAEAAEADSTAEVVNL
ncbi:putative Bis(5-adenosyl)-triphosphatase, partial [Trypanosoma conorhini]